MATQLTGRTSVSVSWHVLIGSKSETGEYINWMKYRVFDVHLFSYALRVSVRTVR
jgi:hypothetical protein